MKAFLKVENFGPIKKAVLDLRDVNVLIGPQASGKSALAKIYTICKSPVLFHSRIGKSIPRDEVELIEFSNVSKPSFKEFEKSLNHFSIKSFLSEKTVIHFESETHIVNIVGNEINFQDKLKINEIKDLFDENRLDEVTKKLKILCQKSENYSFEYDWTLFESRILSRGVPPDTFTNYYSFKNSISKDFQLTNDEIRDLVNEAVIFKNNFYSNKAIYIPSERTIVGLLKQASLNFRNSGIPIPPHLMDYAAQYETATFNCNEIDLGFLGTKKIKYKNVNGQDRIFFDSVNSIPLTESASGFQSLIPMILPIHYLRNISDSDSNFSFVIEELESNLFPKAQYEVIKFLEGGRIDGKKKVDRGSNHTYTTHSPYVLSSLNNMLFAYKLGFKSKFEDKIDKIISKRSWIDPKNFSAYEIRNGKAFSIFNRKTGLISENAIDSVSEDILFDFRRIAITTLDN